MIGAAFLFAAAAAAAARFGIEPAAHHAGRLLRALPFATHPGWIVCPFCGGTRALLAAGAGRPALAAAYSLPACLLLLWLAAQALLRIPRLLAPHAPLAARCTRALQPLERLPWLAAAALAASALQLALHYTGLMPWRVLIP